MNGVLPYGVFSRLAADDGDDADETLYRVENTVADAVMWLGRYALYRAYGEVPSEVLARLMKALDTMAIEGTTNKEVKIGGLVYYIRELTEKELETFLPNEV